MLNLSNNNGNITSLWSEKDSKFTERGKKKKEISVDRTG